MWPPRAFLESYNVGRWYSRLIGADRGVTNIEMRFQSKTSLWLRNLRNFSNKSRKELKKLEKIFVMKCTFVGRTWWTCWSSVSPHSTKQQINQPCLMKGACGEGVGETDHRPQGSITIRGDQAWESEGGINWLIRKCRYTDSLGWHTVREFCVRYRPLNCSIFLFQLLQPGASTVVQNFDWRAAKL
jgi:hypothetical protein